MWSRVSRFILVVLVCAFAPPVAAAQPQLETYQLLLFEKGPNRPAAMPPGGDDLHKEHLAHFGRLQAEGKVVVLGSFGGDGDLRGVAILQADSPGAAKAVFADDPSIKAGRLTVTTMALYSEAANFQKPGTSADTELLYFGFLKSGPNRGQDPEEAKRIQAAHLWHMSDQHAQGALLAAGPIGEGGGDRRGIVVYRVKTMEEARTRAEADPAVKAGRLVVELHPWTVPMGVFK
jgi:uncharacterized protein